MTPDATTKKLLNVGVGLGTGSIAWGHRPETPRAMTITPRDRQILATIENLGYLTTSMIALLFWGKPSSAVHVRLKLLHDAGYLDKLRPRVKASDASREWIYRLSQRGWDDIVAANRPVAQDPYRPAELTSISYVEHDLQLNALLLHIAVLAGTEHGWRGEDGLLPYLPFEILGPRAGIIDPARERRAENASAASHLEGRQVRRERATRGRLEPDATLLGVDRRGHRTAVMIEYDRTRRPHKQLDKLRRYDYFLTAGWRETRYAALDLEPVVLFVCDSERQILPFLRTADKHLTAWHGAPATPRSSGEHTGREQIAITSRARLLSQDWRIVQTSPTPPAFSASGRTASCASRATATLPLPGLLKSASDARAAAC